MKSMATVCLVVMEGSRDAEPLREVQRMSWRLAINSIGRRSTGSGVGNRDSGGAGGNQARTREHINREQASEEKCQMFSH